MQELDVGRKRTGGVDQAHAIAAHLGMGVVFNPTIHIAEEQYGDAILTPLEMRLVKSGPLPSIGERRGALCVEVVYDGGTVTIVNTHLGLSRRDRSAQVAALLGPGWLDNPLNKSPRILLGDFNLVPSSLVYKQITRELVDVWSGSSSRPGKTFPSRLPLLRIDHIFTDRAVRVIDVGVIRTRAARAASDHLPLFAHLDIIPQLHRPQRHPSLARRREEVRVLPPA
ncbi:endonuclease/exonuclease/phosphatase family metal-dependent hydrolase [Phyllobacterium endophyticum]|nr:endonuclease/exonuclease/phosphatase family metal-dependent hydrolase [Phyllobacterium endophyticum]